MVDAPQFKISHTGNNFMHGITFLSGILRTNTWLKTFFISNDLQTVMDILNAGHSMFVVLADRKNRLALYRADN